MTPEIMRYLGSLAQSVLSEPGLVLEVGSLNVNGTARYAFSHATGYCGTDMQAGDGVDMVVNNTDLLATFGAGSFDTVICCETLEHDCDYMGTVRQLREIVKVGGYLVITTPSFGFPEHLYPKHYANFGQDAFREWFFDGMQIVDLRYIDSSIGANTTTVGIARKATV